MLSVDDTLVPEVERMTASGTATAATSNTARNSPPKKDERQVQFGADEHAVSFLLLKNNRNSYREEK